MELKVRCIDARFTKRQGGHVLTLGQEYTVVGLSGNKRILSSYSKSWWTEQCRVYLKQIPGIAYISRRFEVLDKELSLTLPNDLDNLPL